MAKQTFTTGQVLTAAQMTSLQQTAMLGGAASAKTASNTLVAADAGTAISMSNASATTITVNTGLFAAGDTVQITNLGAGVCTITAGTATVNTSASLALAQYESGTLDFTSTSAAIFIKGAGAAASGGMTLLSTTTLSGATTTISSISQDYNILYAVITGLQGDTTDGTFFCAPNGTTNLATGIGTFLDDTTTNHSYYKDDKIYVSGNRSPKYNSANNVFILRIDNYASSTSWKGVHGYATFLKTGDTQVATTHAGGFQSNTAITSLVFSSNSNLMTSGTVKLYGVK